MNLSSPLTVPYNRRTDNDNFYLNPLSFVGYRNNCFLSHTNPYISNVTQQGLGYLWGITLGNDFPFLKILLTVTQLPVLEVTFE